ncbi:MAG: polymerase subunit gamma/tau, partial [Verrucomicrobiota bacterium]
GNSLDVIEIDGASNNSVEDVRELRDNVRYAPAKGKFKIYLIDEVHMLSSAAFNALLKTLEEPPPHVKFIFATTEPQKVLPTILSRCQRFDLHRIPTNLIADHLQFIAKKEKFSLEPAAAHAIARGAEGGLRDAESILDQLVSFCGDPIGEADVLKVFGFTSQQTVSNFTDKILRAQTAEAVHLLHEQCESGKDMMRLMADLISYLRDLLVFKVKPDALNEDVDLELQKSLAAQAELVETERVLELIDQFAEAEGRMKWAPNKKLHFEVAVIKAIQTLSSVTLNEVIENLNALRDGKITATKPVAVAAGVMPAPKKNAADTAAATAEKSVAPNVDVDPAQTWQDVLAKIPKRGFLRTLVDSLGVVGADGRNFTVGYPPDEKSSIETLATTANKKQLENLLKDVSGRDWTLKLVAKEGLTRPKKSDDYKEDAIVQEALEMFKGEIKT